MEEHRGDQPPPFPLHDQDVILNAPFHQRINAGAQFQDPADREDQHVDGDQEDQQARAARTAPPVDGDRAFPAAEFVDIIAHQPFPRFVAHSGRGQYLFQGLPDIFIVQSAPGYDAVPAGSGVNADRLRYIAPLLQAFLESLQQFVQSLPAGAPQTHGGNDEYRIKRYRGLADNESPKAFFHPPEIVFPAHKILFPRERRIRVRFLRRFEHRELRIA